LALQLNAQCDLKQNGTFKSSIRRAIICHWQLQVSGILNISLCVTCL
jgi:hypothetical protein